MDIIGTLWEGMFYIYLNTLLVLTWIATGDKEALMDTQTHNISCGIGLLYNSRNLFFASRANIKQFMCYFTMWYTSYT